MNSITIENLSKELNRLELVSGNIGNAFVNRNGLTILSNLPRNIDEKKFGFMASAIYGAMESAISTLYNELNNITVEYDNYQVIIFAVDKSILIVSLLDLNVDLGLIFIEIEKSLKDLQKIYSE